eukprot:gb/GECG01002423.1/.p1 GENE.gb/GECG01002423.1/~~gb/GECG01002423.1/.p1  ORF type:complete len:256 (+),score=41.67 gb/GECG01002423.1/:1-768(+)
MASKFGGIYDKLLDSNALDSSPQTERGAEARLDADHERSSMAVFLGLDSSITDLAISSCGSYLLSASENGLCCVWDTVSRQRLTTFQNPRASSSATAKKNDDGSAVDSIQRMAMTSLLVLPKEFIVRSPKRDGERALLQPLRKFATPAPLASARYSGEPNEGGTLDEVRIRIPAEYPSMAAENDDTLMERFHEDMLVHLQETTGNAEEQVEEKGGGTVQKDKEIHSLKEQVNALKEENQRWRTVNEKLKALHEQR